jgi:hypothetical protein
MPRPALPVRRPTSFVLLGYYFGWKALSGLLTAIGLGVAPLPEARPEGVELLTAVFAAVAAEALWRCRPWCVRATATYFAAAILMSNAASVAGGVMSRGEAVSVVIGYAILAAIPVLYVKYRARRYFASPPAGAVRIRVAAPQP